MNRIKCDLIVELVAVPRMTNQLRSSLLLTTKTQGFPGGAVVKNPPANAGDTESSPGPGISHVPRSN